MRTDSEYAIEVDKVSRDAWDSLICQFDDAILHQTWSYGSVRWGEENLSHIVLFEQERPVAAVQVRLLQFPIIGGIAYVSSGPLWRRKGESVQERHLERIVAEMRSEYVDRRGLVLRIIPREFEGAQRFGEILTNAGLRLKRPTNKTAMVDLGPPIEQIRKQLVSRWRTELNRSEKGSLKITEGTEAHHFDRFYEIYEEMHARKGFAEFVGVEEMKQVQLDLPDALKMRVSLCEHNDRPIAGAITSSIGQVALAILWASNMEGREHRGAYYLQWKIIERMKEEGYAWYDMGGISKSENPGSYRFKMGLAGKTASEIEFPGEYDCAPRSISSVFVNTGDFLRFGVRGLRKKYGI